MNRAQEEHESGNVQRDRSHSREGKLVVGRVLFPELLVRRNERRAGLVFRDRRGLGGGHVVFSVGKEW